MFSRRISVFKFIIYLSFLILAADLFYFQVIRSGYYRGLAVKNTIRVIPLEASRGTIFDRNKEPLAKDDISFDLVVIPQEVEELQSLVESLSKITGIKESSLYKNYRRNYHVPFAPVRVATNLTKEKAFYFEEKISLVPGALIWSVPRRSYPNREVGSHVIGYVGRIQS